MTDDLVKRLRSTTGDACRCGTPVCLEAADLIEKLEAALRGVIAVADRDTPEFRFARKALEGKDGT